MATQLEYNVLNQRQREIFTKIDILDFNENIESTLEGVCISGGVNVDAGSTIRRNSDLTIVIRDKTLLPAPGSKIWLDKKFVPYNGVRDTRTKEKVWYKQGIFFMSNPQITSANGKLELSLKGLDKMCWLNGQISGSFNIATLLKEGEPLSECIRNLVMLSGETKIMISDVEGMTLSSEIKKSETDTITSILDEIKNLYMGYEYFYDKNGFFVYRKIKDRKNDAVNYDFSDGRLIMEYSNSPDWENIRNDIAIWGLLLSNGNQIKYTLQNNDENSPFSIAKIGSRKLPISDSKIQTPEQAKMRAEYNMLLHSSLNEKVSIPIVPIYDLEPNMIVLLKNESSGVIGRHRVCRFNIPFDNSLSNVEVEKLYYETV
ncbi:hypothetical protein G9F71_008230 [Clostridium sp. FP2]|uniref:hypothetical protein n=1 Tax=Clostridium sp. FP2 TaxID=2724481 RepID=UPI0013E9171C|nr:hypothetical protein [Clostridium sp. FP2]MBZ9622838.1 hypothetical protein [Clostridium sp. FP2]